MDKTIVFANAPVLLKYADLTGHVGFRPMRMYLVGETKRFESRVFLQNAELRFAKPKM